MRPFATLACLCTILTLSSVAQISQGHTSGAAAASAPSEPGPAYSHNLVDQYRNDHKSVSTAAGILVLRTDLSSRVKQGKRIETTLEADVKFTDGSVLHKGTVLDVTVSEVANHTKASPLSTLSLDWTDAQLPKKQVLPIAAMVRDAQGANGVQTPQRMFGKDQLGATSNSGLAGDKLSSGMNLILQNRHEGMPEIAPGVQMLKSNEHSLVVAAADEDLVLHEGTRLVAVLFKATDAK